MPQVIINKWYFDNEVYFWRAILVIGSDIIHIGHYMYESDAVAAGINAKLALRKANNLFK